jgi:microcompartment protein CcmL/EutN
MVIQVETLVATLEARLDKYEKSLAKAVGTTDRQFKAIETRGKRMESVMSRSGQTAALGFTKGMTLLSTRALAVGAGFLSFQATIDKTKAALEEFGNIADKSAQTGLDPEFLQSLAYQTSLVGVGFDDLSGSLATFNKNSGLAVVAKGKMVQALKALNPALLENIRNADSQEERVRLVADAIDKETDASRKAAIASAAFGDEGTKLVAAFQGGAAAIDATMASAQQMGIIVDRDLIARADELGDRFDTATKIMDVNFKQAVVNLAPVLVDAARLAGELAKGIADVVDRMRDVQNQSLSTLETEQGTNALKRLDIENRILDLKRQENDGSISLMDRAELADLEAKNALLKKQDEEMTNVINTRTKAAAAAAGVTDKSAGDNPTLPPISGPSSKSSTKDATAFSDAAQSIQEETTALERQRAAMANLNGASADYAQKVTAIEKATDLLAAAQKGGKEVGKELSDVNQLLYGDLSKLSPAAEQQALVIRTLALGYAAASSAADKLKAAQDAQAQAAKDSIEFQKDLLSGALSDVRSALEDGKLTWEDLGNVAVNVLNKIADKLQDLLLDQLFKSGGLFGSLLGAVTAGTTGGGTAVATASNAVRTQASPMLTKAPRPVNAAGLKQNAVPVDVSARVYMDEDGKWQARVEKIATNVSTRTGKAGLDQYRRGQFRQDWEKHAASRRVKGVI